MFLFAFPAESNFSGRRYPGSLVSRAQNGEFGHRNESGTGLKGSNAKWKVLVDTAKYCATGCFDLSAFPADFAVLSFYKIFGYPTGLGCLVVKKDTLPLLEKQYFGGGAVDAVASNSYYWKTSNATSEQWSDGTIFLFTPFLPERLQVLLRNISFFGNICLASWIFYDRKHFRGLKPHPSTPSRFNVVCIK